MGCRMNGWIDTHVHVDNQNKDGSLRPNLLNELLRVLDEFGADLRLVMSPDGRWMDLARNEPDGAHRANEFIHGLTIGARDRLYGSCFINPNFPDESLKTMEICFEQWGFVQLGEMLQYMLGFRMAGDAACRLVRRAAEYGVPVQVHISTSNTRTHPSSFGREQLLDLFECVQHVPEAKYILAHAVGGAKDNPPVVEEYLDLIEKEYGRWPENFWMEIADFRSPGVKLALKRVPVSRLISGTDWNTRVGPPFLPYGVVFGATERHAGDYGAAALMKWLRSAGADDDAVRCIGFQNAAELLKI